MPPRTRGSQKKSAKEEPNGEQSPNSTTQPDSRTTSPSLDVCPACSEEKGHLRAVGKKQLWVSCESCDTWFHWECVGQGGDLANIDKWYCDPCREANPNQVITYKPPARKSGRTTRKRDYANLHAGIDTDAATRWLQLIQTKKIKKDPFKRMLGSDVSISWLEHDETALLEPIVVEEPEGLGMKMPDKSLTVNDVAELVGPSTPLEVIDVATQSTSPGWTLESWAEYYGSAETSREKIRNVISLEISNTRLAEQVVPPRLVRELDWVEKVWPAARKSKGQYPQVQLYCLMSVAQCWTDWHVDFAGSSVYYHILRGSKIFYFIRPTPANLNAYEKWSGSELQSTTWLGDFADEVFKVELSAGNTMIIPTGWIHAVHTPVDTLVFGGNFLHSYNIGTQLRVRDIEIATRVPKKFRFPYFQRLCWYVCERYTRDLKAKEDFPMRVLEGLGTLADFLVSEARIIERGPESARKEIREQIPGEKVKDPSALAREFRWRVRMAAGQASDNESPSAGKSKREGSIASSQKDQGEGVSAKRKRIDGHETRQGPKFKGFLPRPWGDIQRRSVEDGAKSQCIVRPASDPNDSWLSAWVEGEEDLLADVERTSDEVVRVRKVDDDGSLVLERQVITRIQEVWRLKGRPEGALAETPAKLGEDNAAPALNGRGSTAPPPSDESMDGDPPPADANGVDHAVLKAEVSDVEMVGPEAE
ncbi:hypothetical protein BOTBODRAFT_34637 [Botryobasidium botryosum FD-172 SS1]|uniref:JmjC domain-containing histone demethylation protein 1 n=1 Tax=Botryobasidium botryosum (strain FD-172 SS1) TaxID=930990 RepID=A0A067M9Y5_BOTB1|nr:hypothetical protein BOTBODRAFT_34637 [Botryobasidium botryosum FD-172 SS1]